MRTEADPRFVPNVCPNPLGAGGPRADMWLGVASFAVPGLVLLLPRQ